MSHQFTDEELMAQFQAGNENAYLEIVERFKDRLFAFIYRFVGDEDLAEDLVQSALGLGEREYELPSEDFAPSKTLEGEQIEKHIRMALAKLPLHFRTVIILRDVQELSYEEISKIMKIPLGTVKSRVNRARLRLQEMLSDLRIKGGSHSG